MWGRVGKIGTIEHPTTPIISMLFILLFSLTSYHLTLLIHLSIRQRRGAPTPVAPLAPPTNKESQKGVLGRSDPVSVSFFRNDIE